MVHQHFRLVEAFTVAENLILGREHENRRALDMRRPGRRPRALGALPARRDPDGGRDLSVGAQQRVEIFKALATREY